MYYSYIFSCKDKNVKCAQTGGAYKKKSKIFQNTQTCRRNLILAQMAGISIMQLPHAKQSEVEVCGEAVDRPEAEMVCDQEWKDRAAAALSSQNTADPPELRPQKEEMERNQILSLRGFLALFLFCFVFFPGPYLV